MLAAAPTGSGLDEIEFAFAPNVGEPVRPLRQIASSGEMSRVMLAVKVVLAAHDKIPVLVFDEIDANVGGEMGKAVGEPQTRALVLPPEQNRAGRCFHGRLSATRRRRSRARSFPI